MKPTFLIEPLLLLLGASVVSVLVNRFAPHERGRVRRTFFLYGAFVLCLLVSVLLGSAGATKWADRFALCMRLFEGFVVVNLLALAFFDVALPAAKIRVVSITSDLVVGVAYIVASLGVLRGAGMDLSSVIATSAIVSGVLALSLQATLGNILGGVALQLDGSIHVDDWVQLENGKQGKVKAIRWRHTVLETRDWDTIVVPNASLLASNIQILGKRIGQATVQHRMTFFFNVDFRFSPTRVIEVVEEALRASPLDGIADDPKPHCLVYDLAKDGRDSFGYYLVRYWLIDLDRDDRAQSLVRTRVYSALRRAGIPLARPVSTVFVATGGDEDPDERRTRHLRMRSKVLASLELFAVLGEEVRTQLADSLAFAPFDSGERIATAGEEAQCLYVLSSGEVEVRARGADGASHVVATLSAPNIFGEMGLMTGERRTADVVALGPVECYRLDKPAFQRIILADPQIVDAMSETLARRRVELLAVREGLDARAKEARQANEQKQILGRIRTFFGLGM